MQVKLIDTVEVDPMTSNLDYSKYAVYENGKYITNIYKHNEAYYNLSENTPFETIDQCLISIEKFYQHKLNNVRSKGKP